jgi:hypothetical protein
MTFAQEFIDIDPPLTLRRSKFRRAFSTFRGEIRRITGERFSSFREGLPHDLEGYKLPLRHRALRELDIDRWTQEMVGSGEILKRSIASVELRDSEESCRNNLVEWSGRWGPKSRSHRMMIEAMSTKATRRRAEQLLYQLFRLQKMEEPAFRDLVAAFGKRYDLLAYLFFLKDCQRFMPIAPTAFDDAFATLGITHKTSGKCSWRNYQGFNTSLSLVSDALRGIANVPNIRLIDAHSFCYMLTYLPERDIDLDDSREAAVRRMVASVRHTVAASQDEAKPRPLKLKEQRLSDAALAKLIRQLLAEQSERCKLTGIPLRFRASWSNGDLSPSLDRIDSNGHYEKGNLQVVCQFINFWKSDRDNDEFKALLELVRHQED